MEFKGDTFIITSEEALRFIALQSALGFLSSKKDHDEKTFNDIKAAEQDMYDQIRNCGFKVKLQTISLDAEV